MTLASYHPVAVPVWTPDHRKLPRHTLCLSHVTDSRGRKRCLAVPEAEAPKYLAELERFSAFIARVQDAHSYGEAARAATPIVHPKSRIPKRIKPVIPSTKLHRHKLGSPCLTPIDVPGESGWFSCTIGAPVTIYGENRSLNGYVHVHRTKRGRAFLVRHLQGEASCPATIARKAAEAADAALPCPANEECGHRKGDHHWILYPQPEHWRCQEDDCQCGANGPWRVR